MAYTQYLQQLLSPLGVYDLEEDSVSGACLGALGEELDEIWALLQQNLADAFPQSAADPALLAWERCLPPHPCPESPAERQQALAAILGQGGLCPSAGRVEALLDACGLTVSLEEADNAPTVTVTAQNVPSGQTAALNLLLRKLIPAHLQIQTGT